MTATFPIRLLMCPNCSGKFELFLYSFHPHYGLLKCKCREYPIVYSIPILADFPESKALLELIRERDTKSALLKTLGAFCTNSDFQKKGPYDLRTKQGQERMLQIIDDPLITFQQTLQMLCQAPEADAMFFRYANSSLVAGLALMALSTEHTGPFVHLACGAGHLERTLSNRIPGSMLIGVEQSFPYLYAARKYMAPESHFVYADLSKRLPFQNDSFDLALTNERLYAVSKQEAINKEIGRVTHSQDGSIIASCVPPETDGLGNIFPDHRKRKLSVKRLIERFVKEHAVDTTSDESNAGPQSFVVTKRPNLFTRREVEDLISCRSPRVNPVYLMSEIGEMIKLERREDLPTSLLDPALVEAGALPAKVEFSKQIIKELQDGQVSPQAMDLLFRMVLVDLPLDYS